jgi:hypothetical protein
MKIGKVVAVCTSATIMGVGESEVINQPAPISCIQVPMLEATAASQMLRNSLICSGDQAEPGAGKAAWVFDASFKAFSLTCQLPPGEQKKVQGFYQPAILRH